MEAEKVVAHLLQTSKTKTGAQAKTGGRED